MHSLEQRLGVAPFPEAHPFNRIPQSWQRELLRRLDRLNYADMVTRWERELARLVEADKGGVRPDAGDAEVCQVADLHARDMDRRLDRVIANAKAKGASDAAALRLAAFHARHILRQRELLQHWQRQWRAGPAVARMRCPRWWRRVLRRMLARTGEAMAVGLGLVRKGVGLYCSREALARCTAQDIRNAGVLSSVYAVNENAQAYTLADLAARGVANQQIRRVELLTRVAGFEQVAKDLGHLAVMVTVTCPSRFHAARVVAGGRTEPNPRYDGSTPRQAQTYLSEKWAKARAAAARAGLQWYGFRIAEPQQDGTPHWHLLLFYPPGVGGDSLVLIQEIFRRYFLLEDSPNEPGAAKHRCDFEPIDWAKGSAVGYVIKYISKNIDGHGVGYDLYGEPAIESSARVRAWARTWGIRQFQQIGGAPVGIWRELRRLNPEALPVEARTAVHEATSVVNLADLEPGVKAKAWARYTMLQGGPCVVRKALRVRLMREDRRGLTKYGERAPFPAVGVFTADGVEQFRNHIHVMRPQAAPFERRVALGADSERSAWLSGFTSEAQALRVGAEVFRRSGAAASTRIHVNNCTRPAEWRAPRKPNESEFAPALVRRFKTGRHRGWQNRAGAAPPETT